MRWREAELPGGLRLVTETIPYVRSVAVGFWVGAGSRFEAEGEQGITHFIEHMVFKGTSARSARDIAHAIDALGGQVNAFTGREVTSFYARVLDEQFPAAVDLLVDMIFRPRFDAEDMEREKGVVVEEILMYEDSPEELVHDLLTQVIWPEDPLGRPIQGSVQSIRSFDREQVLDYYRRFYRPANMVVAVAGAVEHERVVQVLGESLAHLNAGERVAPRERPVARPGRAGREKEIEQVHLCLGSEGVGLTDERLPALGLLATIVGGGTSSRLFQEIREERGLAYAVSASHHPFHDTGFFSIYLAASPAAAHDALGLCRRILGSLRKEGVEAEELERARQHLKAGLLISLESTTARMSWLGRSLLLLGRVRTPEEEVSLLDRVSAGDVRELAGAVLDEERLGLAWVGPPGFSPAC